MAIAVLLTLMAPGWIGTISGRSAGASILTGLAVEVLFVPALIILVVALTVSIIGIPLLASDSLPAGRVWRLVGRRLHGRGRSSRARSSWPERGDGTPSVSDFLIGYAIIIAITVLGQLMALGLGWLSPVTWPMRSAGLLVEYVAWTIGLGAAVTSLFATPRIVPPPVPV